MAMGLSVAIRIPLREAQERQSPDWRVAASPIPGANREIGVPGGGTAWRACGPPRGFEMSVRFSPPLPRWATE
jgi:hypothetical protein